MSSVIFKSLLMGTMILFVNVAAQDIEFVGSYNGFSDAYDVVVRWPYAYVCEYSTSSGLVVIDVSSPANPTFVSRYITPGCTHDLAISGDFAFLADDTQGLNIVDILYPRWPQYVGGFDTPDRAFGVCVDDEYVYIANGYAGFYIFNISNPWSPDLVGTYDTPYSSSGVWVDQNKAYVTDHDYSLHIFDITNRSNPQLLASIDTPGYARRGIAVVGDYAYIPDWGAGLQIIDVSDPTAPLWAGNYNSEGHALNVWVKHFAYVTLFEAGIVVLDISYPPEPRFLAAYNTPGTARGICVSNGFIFVADVTSLQILKLSATDINSDSLSTPDIYSLFKSYPNPFNTNAVLIYDVLKGGHITLDIYNVSGQKIESLFDGIEQEGNYRKFWYANNLASGIYFARLLTPSYVASTRLIYIK